MKFHIDYFATISFIFLFLTSCQKDKTPPIIRIYSEVYNETQAMRERYSSCLI
jgi:hypothetical protein